MERIHVILGGERKEHQTLVIKCSQAQSWHTKSKYLGYLPVSHYWHLCLLHHFIQKQPRKKIWLMGNRRCGDISKVRVNICSARYVPWNKCTASSEYFSFEVLIHSHPFLDGKYNLSSFVQLQNLEVQHTVASPMNFHLCIHEVAPMVGTRKCPHGMGTQVQVGGKIKRFDMQSCQN